MTNFMRTQALGCICFLVGCGDLAIDLSEPPLPDPDMTTEPTPAEDDAPPPVDADAGADPAIPLASWVEGLVDQGMNETALPDTVDDKNIEDTDDPHAFDAYF